jgi:ELWxxDGT repeat protein
MNTDKFHLAIPLVMAVLSVWLAACSGGGGGGGNADSALPFRVFAAAESTEAFELWRTDGTEAGTVRVKDINPGPAASSPFGFTLFNGAWYFEADDGAKGRELWKTDGTEAGTVMVKDINATALGASSNPFGFTVLNGALYFAADDGVNGVELWKTDGTADGTKMVRNINSTAVGGGSNPDSFTVFSSSDVLAGSELYFSADDGVNGRELWKTNGTEAGTEMVKNINTTAAGAGSGPNGFMSMRTGSGPLASSELFFSADDGTNGRELWKTDGTSGGTVMVKDINATAVGASSSLFGITVFNGALYFSADDGVNGRELWKSDGTGPGTVMVKDINAAAPGANSYPGPFAIFNGALYFAATDVENGVELWKSNGSVGNAELVKDINATSAGIGSDLADLTVFNGALYFSAGNGENGVELWRTDGTRDGTVMVKNINTKVIFPPRDLSSFPQSLVVLNNALHFGANDGDTGFELWKTDGTEAGTVQIKDICPGPCSGHEFLPN